MDELQVIDGWELFVRQKLDEGYKVFVTGSKIWVAFPSLSGTIMQIY